MNHNTDSFYLQQHTCTWKSPSASHAGTMPAAGRIRVSGATEKLCRRQHAPRQAERAEEGGGEGGGEGEEEGTEGVGTKWTDGEAEKMKTEHCVRHMQQDASQRI
jgi:hypothetical protein